PAIAQDPTGADPPLPSYAQVALSGNFDYTWATNTGSPFALQNAAGTGDIAACWGSASIFDIDVNITDGRARAVSLYALDWHSTGPAGPGDERRSERVDVLDAATGAVLDSRTLTDFQGQYLTWTISGSVVFR